MQNVNGQEMGMACNEGLQSQAELQTPLHATVMALVLDGLSTSSSRQSYRTLDIMRAFYHLIIYV